MNSEDKFKELLNEKLNAKEFSFNEKNWDSMRTMIDETREKKGRRAILLLLCFLCITGTLFLYLYLDVPSKRANPSLIAENKMPVAKTEPQAVVESEPKVRTTLPVQANERKTTLVNTSSVNKAAEVTTKEAAQKDETKPVMKSASPDLLASAGKQITKTEKPVTVSKKRFVPLVQAVTRSKAANEAEKEVRNTDQQTESKEKGKGTEEKDSPFLASGNSGSTSSDEKDPDSGTQGENKKDDLADTGSAKKATENATIAITTEALAQTPSAMLTGTQAAENLTVSAVEKTDIILPPENPFIKHTLAIEAGANYLAGWNAPSKRDGSGFNFIAGVSYMRNLTRKVALSTGMYYTSVMNLSAFSHTSTVTRYGFGEKKDVTVVTPEKIHYLQFPLKVNMALDDKNIIGLGYTLGYLLTVNSQVETYSQGYDISSAPSFSKVKGYTQGFNKFDSQVSVFYRRTIYKKLFINAEALYGVADIKKNGFFNSSSFERNMGLKFTIGYNLFQK